MIRTLTAFTHEIDDANIAVAELLGQLDLEKNQLKSSVALVTCYSEFIDTGVIKLLAAHLPFPLVGATTIGNMASAESGRLMLSLAVLTSDDVVFSAAVSDSLWDEQAAPLKKAYDTATSERIEKPSMIFTFSPLINHVGGDIIIAEIDKISGGTPNFGMTAVDSDTESGRYANAQTIFGGEAYKNSAGLVLLFGDVNPKFYVASVSSEKVRKQRALITDAEGTILKAVNGMTAIQYMESIGMATDGQLLGGNSIPFIVDYNDSTAQVTRAIFAATPEGYVVCGGEMPINGTLSIGYIDYADIIKTTGEAIKAVLSDTKSDGLILFSCIARNFSLGADTDAEMEAIQKAVGSAVPYTFAYAGGEICPVYTSGGKVINRYHNYTMIACAF